jgi:hypothetical protein
MGKKITNDSASFDYFFVKPSVKGNVHKAAKKLIGIKGIREVSITEGDYGFVVKADFLYERDNDFLYREIIKVVGGTSKKALCYCQYNK